MNTVGVRFSAQLTLSGAFQTVVSANPVGIRVCVIHLVNTTGAPVTVQVCVVPHGGTPSVANALLYDYSIPANDFLQFDEGDFLSPNSTLQALASAGNSVNLRFSGVQE